MFDIDYFTYRKEPFTCLNSIGIHPLDDKGLEKYLSKDSYTHSYLRRTSPYIVESMLKDEEEEDTENKKSKDNFSTLNQENKLNKTKNKSIEKKTKCNFKDNNKNTLNTSKKNLINNTRTITEGSLPDKTKLLNKKYNLNQNFTTRNYYNANRDEEHTSKTLRNNGLAVSMDKTRFNNRYKLKMHKNKNKLPLFMSTQHNAKNTISFITGYSKEMGEHYNPYAFISPSINRTKRNYVGGLYHC